MCEGWIDRVAYCSGRARPPAAGTILVKDLGEMETWGLAARRQA